MLFNKQKILLIITICIIMVISLFGCKTANKIIIGGNVDSEVVVSLIGKGGSNEYWQTVSKGGFYSGEKNNVKLIYKNPSDEEDLEEQISMMEGAISDKVAAIILAPISIDGLNPTIDKAKAAGVKVVIIDNNVSSDNIDAFIGTNNEKLGREAAKRLSGIIGEGGQVAVIAHNGEAASAVDRVDGFLAEIGENFPNVIIGATAYSGGKVNEVTKIAEGLILDNKDLMAIFATSESVCQGVLSAIAKTQRTDITILGVDASDAEIKALQSDELSGLLLQNPYLIGYLGVETASRLLRGENIERETDTGFIYVDKSNINDMDVQRLLYPLSEPKKEKPIETNTENNKDSTTTPPSTSMPTTKSN